MTDDEVEKDKWVGLEAPLLIWPHTSTVPGNQELETEMLS